jgi:hypothetical protein
MAPKRKGGEDEKKPRKKPTVTKSNYAPNETTLAEDGWTLDPPSLMYKCVHLFETSACSL